MMEPRRIWHRRIWHRLAGHRLVAAAAAAAVSTALLAGCGHRLVPPQQVEDPVTVHVVDHGRHAGLVLPDADGLTEWFWGDWAYFAAQERSLASGARALFASDGATLGRRDLPAGLDAADVQRRLAAEAVHPLRVERHRAAALSARLDAAYRRRAGEEVRHRDGRRFVPDPEGGYGLTNTSVDRVAVWLEELGVSVEGGGVTARYSVDPPGAGSR